MKFFTKLSLLFLAAIICAQLLPGKPPLTIVTAQKREFRTVIRNGDREHMSMFMSLFGSKWDSAQHKKMSKFCVEVMEPVCSEEIRNYDMDAGQFFFCGDILEKCGQYKPESIK